MIRAVLLALLLVSSAAFGQDEPRALVRTRLEPAGPVVPGQQVKLFVDVLVTTWFTQAPELPTVKLQGAVVMLSDEQLPHLSEDIEGQHWSGISRLYTITPQIGGELVIPAFEIGIHAGQAKAPMKLATKPVRISVKGGAAPAQAAGGPTGGPGQVGNLPATTHLRLSQRFDRKLADLKVGDAFTRTITIVADGTMAMFLPPTTFPPVKGLAMYPKPPKVENISKERVGFVAGERVDSVTYVVQAPGHYDLQGIVVKWWDVGANRERTSTISPLSFEPAPNPGYKPEFSVPTEPLPARSRMDWRRVGAGSAAAVLALAVGWFVFPFLRREWQAVANWRTDRRRQHEASEALAFATLKEAVQTGDDGRTTAQLYRWLDKLPATGGMASRAEAIVGQAAFSSSVTSLLERCYGGQVVARDARDLSHQLTGARKQLLRNTAKEEPHSLPHALNPQRAFP
jgi:hypothetical protein